MSLRAEAECAGVVSSNNIRRSLLIASSALSLFSAQPSLAQQAASGASNASGSDVDNDGEIVVTATRDERLLSEVPLAVSAVRVEELSRSGSLRLEDSLIRVPGAAVSNTSAGGGQTRLVIRGLQAAPGGNPVVAAYIDDTPINSSVQSGGGASFPDLDPADMERIEVLRGPQGTLYGAASMGGLIKYVTIQPKLDELSGRIEIGYSSVEHGGLGAQARGRLNVPLSDAVALTVSGFGRLDPGFVDSVTDGKEDYNEARRYGGRVALLFKPSDDLSIKLSGLHQSITNDATTTINITRAGAPLLGGTDYYRVARSPNTDSLQTKFSLADLTVDWNPGGIRIVSNTSYSKQKTIFGLDFGPYIGNLLDTLVGTPPGTLSIYDEPTLRARKFTQELRLASDTSGFFNWQTGVFYTHENNTRREFGYPILKQTGLAPPPDLVIPAIGAFLDAGTYSEIAGFGTITLKFSDAFQVAGGLRYSHNVQRATAETVAGLATGAASLRQGQSSDNTLTFNINPEYKIAPGVLLYGRVATGFRPGGINFRTPTFPSYEADSLISYEIGTKAGLLRDAIMFDLNIFRADWKDIQIRQLFNSGVTPVGYIGNAGKARVQGVEFAAVVEPVFGLTFDGNISYTDAKVTTTTLLAVEGSQLPITPKWAAQAGVTYETEIAPDWTLSGNASYRYVGPRFAYFETPRYRFEEYDTIDLRLGVEHNGVTLDAFVRNLTDVRAYNYATNVTSFVAVSLIQPRTYGFVIGKKF